MNDDSRPEDGETAAGSRPAQVRLRGVSMRFGNTTALHPIDLDVRAGDFLALLGPSGCGKTTLLRLIGGFLQPSSGTVEIEGRDVTALPPERRRTNMVFQGYGLFPHMTVRQNIAYGLRVAGRPKAEIDEKVKRMIELVHLQGFENRAPDMLSGGQQQRVALARALVMEPAVLLLDESLAALDLKLRKSMQDELRQLHRSVGGTFVFVTHDQGEAMALASRIAVMQEGRIIQQGDPKDIYSNPNSEFVAGFIGDANLLRGERSGGVIRLEAGLVIASPGPDGTISVVVRPEHMQLSSSAGDATVAQGPALRARVVDVIYMGTHVAVKTMLESGQSVVVHVEVERMAETPTARGQEVTVTWHPQRQRIIEWAQS